MKFRFLLLLFTGLGSTLMAQTLAGDWFGELNIQGAKLPIVLHLEEAVDGWSASMDSPSQGARGIPMNIEVIEDSVVISSERLQLAYTGTYQASPTERLVGTFQQGTLQLPLTMNREQTERVPRPQEPTDFPYEQREVSFPSATEGVTLAGTLTLPQDGPVKKAVILLSGSGAQNRDEAILDHRPFLVLSDYLTRRGIAVLRYDDRGVGESTGNYGGSTIFDFANDARGALQFMQRQTELAGAQIGFAGHSEGGITGAMVAADQQSKVDFMVLLASPAVRGDSLLILQNDAMLRKSGLTDSLREAYLNLHRAIHRTVLANPDTEKADLEAVLLKTAKEWANALPADIRTGLGDVDSFAEPFAQQSSTPYFRTFFTIDPAEYLQQMDQPILALNGTLDLQVTPEENIQAIKDATKRNNSVRTEILEGLNHLFQPAITGMVSEYGMLRITFDEEAMAIVAEWVNGL